MLNNGGFLQPCNSQNCLATAGGGASSTPAQFMKKPRLFLVPKSSPVHTLRCRIGLFSSYSLKFPQTHISFRAVLGERCSGFRVFSQKKGSKGSTSELEAEGFEDDEEDFEDGDEDFDEFEDDEDEDVDVILPTEEMEKWLVKKSTGFGEGKAYDTSVEEKLLEELEKSKQVQAAKISSVNPKSKKGDMKKKEPQVVPAGTVVRVTNLPKKKNIQRDLKLAFKGVPGIINITPMVLGNEKTRDPVCKGYGFIDFKSEQDASRFIQTFSKQAIAFGKVRKQVKYEIMKSPSSKKSSNGRNFTPGQRLSIIDETRDMSIHVVESLWKKTSLESNKSGDEVEDIEDSNLIMAEMEDTEDYDLMATEMEDYEDDDLMATEMEDYEDDDLIAAEMEDSEDGELVTAEMEGTEDSVFVAAEMEDSEDYENLKMGESENGHMEPRVKSLATMEECENGRMEPRVKSLATSSSNATKERLKAKGRGEKVPKVEDKVKGTGRKVPKVEVVRDNLSAGDGKDTSTDSDEDETIRLLEQRLLAKMRGEKVPELDTSSQKWMKIKEEIFQSNVSKQPKEPKSTEKKPKAKGGKPRKVAIPTSAKRLRIREKTVLTNVFAKYGSKGDLGSKEES